MSNREILNWWDSLGIVKCINLREKYEYGNSAVLDVDDYRFIYNREFKSNYIVYNEIEDKNIFEGNVEEFIDFTKTIVNENGDTDYSILGISDAIIYIEDYCESLKFIEHE